jgi:hypothetical protein
VVPRSRTAAIDSVLTGSVSPNGTLTMSFADDLFPSHGIQIMRDGKPALTQTIGDASCLAADKVVGVGGAATIAWGLTHQDNRGTLTVTPLANGIVVSLPSPLCSETLWGTIVSGASSVAPASDAAAAPAAPRIRIAPVNGGVAGPAMSIRDAQNAGLISAVGTDAGTLITSNAAQPVQLTASGSHVVLRTVEIVDGRARQQRVYGPFTGTAVLSTGNRPAVTANGKPARPHPARRRPPVTRANLRLHGKRAIVRFTVSDRAGVAYTRAYLGTRRLRVSHGTVTVARARLAKLRFYSVDPFGNVERAHGLGALQLRRAGVARPR